MITMSKTFFLLVFCLLPNLQSCFQVATKRGKIFSATRGLCSMEMDQNIKQNLDDRNFATAYELLKRNPMASLSKDDARAFLNNLDQLVSEKAIGSDDQQLLKIEATALVYNRLTRQQVLRGFGCVDRDYPENISDISPIKLEEITGLPMAALTPKERTTYWRLAGIALCLGEYIFGTSVGIDPLFTLIPATFFLFGFDQLVYRGAFFESFYQKLFPEYKKKIICHEAGHFLISYILGVAVRNCVTNAWEARKYPDITGQAGTVFYDTRFQDEMSSQKVSRASLDRLSVVLMAGIAAEAVRFGKAEGGAADEAGLIQMLSVVQPPWSMLRVQGQARWAAVQAVQLIREHQASYDALVDALEAGLPVGDCVIAIEENLPPCLPSEERAAARRSKRKAVDTDAMLGFIKRMTAQVGGVASASNDEDALELQANAAAVGKAFAAAESEKQAAALAADAQQVRDQELARVEPRSIVGRFTETIDLLKRAVEEGKVNATDAKNGGGIWLNNLDSFHSPTAQNFDIISQVIIPADPKIESEKEEVIPNKDGMVTLPPPLEGYEERLRLLQAQEQQEQSISGSSNNAESLATAAPTEPQLWTAEQRRTAARDLVGFAQQVVADPGYFLAEERRERTRLTLVSLLTQCDKSLLEPTIKLELDEVATDPLKWEKFVADLRGAKPQQPLVIMPPTSSAVAEPSPEPPSVNSASNVDSFAVVAKSTQFIPTSRSIVAAVSAQTAPPTAASAAVVPVFSPEALLQSHRGFQLKKIEIDMAGNRKKMQQIKQRMEELSKEAATTAAAAAQKTTPTTSV